MSMETSWISPRKREEERLALLALERKKYIEKFDKLADAYLEGLISIDELKEIMALPDESLWVPNEQ